MKLLQTKEYLYLIDKEAKIKKGDLVAPRGLASYKVKSFDPLFDSSSFHYKVIAYFPLTKDSKELDLPLLPNPFKEDNNILNFINNQIKYWSAKKRTDIVLGTIDGLTIAKEMIAGYKAAQSKQFSLEDMQRAIRIAKDSVGVDNDGETCYSNKSDEEIIQSLSTQQLPKEFEPKYRPKHVYGENVLKIEKNSEGKQEICGKYVY